MSKESSTVHETVQREIDIALDLIEQIHKARSIRGVRRRLRTLRNAVYAAADHLPERFTAHPQKDGTFLALIERHIDLELREKALKSAHERAKAEREAFDAAELAPAWDNAGAESIAVHGYKVYPREDRWLLPNKGTPGPEAAAVLKSFAETEKFVKEGYSAQTLRSYLREKEEELAQEKFGKGFDKLSAIQRAELLEEFELPEPIRETFHVDIRRKFLSARKG